MFFSLSFLMFFFFHFIFIFILFLFYFYFSFSFSFLFFILFCIHLNSIFEKKIIFFVFLVPIPLQPRTLDFSFFCLFFAFF